MTAKSKVRIGVVGLGWVGTARHIPTLASLPSFHLVGVADRNADRIANLGGVAKSLRSSAGKTLRDIDWIDEVDAISIATAPFAHRDLAVEALERGLHVITEKPFAMTPAEGREMIGAAAEADRQLNVVHNFQFARSMRQLRRDIEVGKFGEIRGVRAMQLGNPSRRLPIWFEDLPLGLFYDESPHLLYLAQSLSGPLTLAKSVIAASRRGATTPAQVDAWFTAEGADYPITLSCNFESSLSEWHIALHGEKAVGIVDVFRDIYLRLPNDGAHGTRDVLTSSVTATGQHWWQHVRSGIPHLTGRLRYGNDHVFSRFARAINGDSEAAEPISSAAAQRIVELQHAIVDHSERVYA